MVQRIGLSSHGVQTVPQPAGATVLDDVSGVGWTDMAGRHGWGITYRGQAGAGCWFTSPLPHSELSGHRPATLGELILRFDALGTARVTAVELWCGEQRLRRHDGLDLSGDQVYHRLYHPELELTAGPVEVRSQVAFGAAGSITFLGAYGRFLTPDLPELLAA